MGCYLVCSVVGLGLLIGYCFVCLWFGIVTDCYWCLVCVVLLACYFAGSVACYCLLGLFVVYMAVLLFVDDLIVVLVMGLLYSLVLDACGII